jgi:hypothetical protein
MKQTPFHTRYNIMMWLKKNNWTLVESVWHNYNIWNWILVFRQK